MSAEPEEREKEEKIFKDVSEAYSVLSDLKKKNRYDSGQDLDELEMPGEYLIVTCTIAVTRTNCYAAFSYTYSTVYTCM